MNRGNGLSTWVEVDLDAISNNVRYFIEKTGAEVMAIVKANGYGHGAIEAAQAAIRGGATWLGIARVGEAIELRKARLKEQILILGYTPPDRMAQMIKGDISMTLWSDEQLEAAALASRKMEKKARVHIKVDTGMSRLGIRPEQAVDFFRKACAVEELNVEGVYTHFACADDEDPEVTEHQLGWFMEVLDALKGEGLLPGLVHASNSSATLKFPEGYFDIVRLGLAMYGLAPSPHIELPGVIRPALSWYSTLVQVKTLPAGRGISYGHHYRTEREERIGTIPVGYADGFRRTDGGKVLIHGRLAPVVGRVTMDQIMVNLDHLPEAGVGDEVVIIGSQGDQRIDADDHASLWGTISWEVLCGLCARVPRVYLQSDRLTQIHDRISNDET